ncbi:MAG: type II secretion system F family protein [Nanoarchaeota archaeon]
MRFRNIYFVGAGISLAMLVLDFVIFFNFSEPGMPTVRWFYPWFIISLIISGVHPMIDFLNEMKYQKRVEEKFVDFSRDLESSVKSGITIPSAIIQASQKDYSELTPFIKKLANQIKVGIPIHKALLTFAQNTNNSMIRRSIAIVIEAEASGGDIDNVLKSVTDAMVSIKKLKEERKSGTYGQIVQGYIVYFVFIGIMLVLQLKLFPQLAKAGASVGDTGMNLLGSSGVAQAVNLDTVFFALVLIQGFFAGLMIGKFSEGRLKSGIIHSIVLCTMAALAVTTAKGGI